MAKEDRDPDQAWFWTPEWQQMEREADEDIAAGRVESFDSGEAFLAALEAHAKAYDAKKALNDAEYSLSEAFISAWKDAEDKVQGLPHPTGRTRRPRKYKPFEPPMIG